MDVWKVPKERQQGWYLNLMAPNIKGKQYPWLDPSRLYCNSQALHECVEDLLQPFQNDEIDLVAGIDAMGFILGSAIAKQLEKGFLAIRKAGHLCVKTDAMNYSDYSGREKVLEVRTDAIKEGIRVLLVDQWIETGGTMEAAIKLVVRQGGIVAGIAAICIEESEGGKHILQNYKCSQCVPPHLKAEFNEHSLQSFLLFRNNPLHEEPGYQKRVCGADCHGCPSCYATFTNLMTYPTEPTENS
ncbi:adenine phosphoribosyltransferase-like [Protopterus annectens]|uniref:adenine phosphoribosyltransferase-like n=1 Tax=Protopterus annectens TaxID=7888 RepID=UPI001CF92F1D|nr:adenine phosphoribosyltransferase-like [Protopterus annectens]